MTQSPVEQPLPTASTGMVQQSDLNGATVPGKSLELPADFSTGLEDFEASDLRMPRLNIDHEKGVLVDSLSGQEFPVLEIITLGLIKQRVLWKPQIEEKAEVVPLCKSANYKVGYPTTVMRDPADNFPWHAVGLNPNDLTPDEDGRITFPCESCRLKDWKTHPIDGKKQWCTVQHSIPLLYGELGNDPYMTAMFTAQRSSIKSSTTFFASIARRQLPAFAVRAQLSLQALKRGQNTYYVPVFREIGPTKESEWLNYSSSYRQIRDFVTQPPMPRDPDGNIVDPDTLAQSNQMPVQQAPMYQGGVIPGQVVPSGYPQFQQPQQPQPDPWPYPQPQPDPWAQQPQYPQPPSPWGQQPQQSAPPQPNPWPQQQPPVHQAPHQQQYPAQQQQQYSASQPQQQYSPPQQQAPSQPPVSAPPQMMQPPVPTPPQMMQQQPPAPVVPSAPPLMEAGSRASDSSDDDLPF